MDIRFRYQNCLTNLLSCCMRYFGKKWDTYTWYETKTNLCSDLFEFCWCMTNQTLLLMPFFLQFNRGRSKTWLYWSGQRLVGALWSSKLGWFWDKSEISSPSCPRHTKFMDRCKIGAARTQRCCHWIKAPQPFIHSCN